MQETAEWWMSRFTVSSSRGRGGGAELWMSQFYLRVDLPLGTGGAANKALLALDAPESELTGKFAEQIRRDSLVLSPMLIAHHALSRLAGRATQSLNNFFCLVPEMGHPQLFQAIAFCDTPPTAASNLTTLSGRPIGLRLHAVPPELDTGTWTSEIRSRSSAGG